MNTIYFYYSPVCYKLLTVDRSLGSDDRGNDIVTTLAHDFKASLKAIVAPVVAPLTTKERLADRLTKEKAQHDHKNFTKSPLYKDSRNDLIKSLQNSRTPNWASVKISKL